jgi:uncharacterized protein (DUF1015 family)
MATVRPFRALRPTAANVDKIAEVPYDVVNVEEARELGAGNPLSFIHVSRAEIDLPEGTDVYSGAVYAKARENFERLRTKAPLVVEQEPAVYFYRLQMGNHAQTGLAACYSVDEYEADLIKKHERTRRDKEDDRTRHISALRAQTGPVFLTYRASRKVDEVAGRVTECRPLFDFQAPDGVRHTVWPVTGDELARVVSGFAALPCLYIADGHHRAASAARTRKALAEEGIASAEADWMLAVAFPDNQAQILPYNRVVKDLAGLAPEAFLAELGSRFTLEQGGASPARKGEVAMYLGGRWHTIVFGRRGPSGQGDVISSLDVSLLQEHLLAPVLKIADPRSDKRIDFVGGIRGTSELEKLVDQGKAAVAFSLFPVGVDDLMRIADAGGIMPPKSTWFEPKLRDGLLTHLI